MKIKPFCDDIALLNGTLYTDETNNSTLNITLKNPAGKHIIAQAKEITTREEAEKTKYSLYVSRETLPETDEDEFYHEDLIGLTAHEGDQTLGKVKSVENFGAGDLLEITPKNGESYFVPFDNEYIEAINLNEKNIRLKNVGHFKL